MPSILILGGGIIGAGVARDAVLRGIQVTLLEKDTIGHGTSSHSSRLIHGGIRYLELGDFHLVYEALRERGVLLKQAPGLVRQQPFLFLTGQGEWWQWFRTGIGVMLYRLLAGNRALGPHYPLTRREVSRREPLLKAAPILGGALYQDARGDDLGLVKANIAAAREAGAKILEQTHAVCKLDESGVTATLPDGSIIRADLLVIAAGPWTDLAREEVGLPARRIVAGTKGIHIAFPWTRVPLRYAIAMRHPRDQRVMFGIPEPERNEVYFGTTDTDTDESPDQLSISEADVDYLMEAVTHYFPELILDKNEISFRWVGVRPLLRQAGKETSRSREHLILAEGRSLTIAGGKLTTYRSIAEAAVDRIGSILGIQLPDSLTAELRLED